MKRNDKQDAVGVVTTASPAALLYRVSRHGPGSVTGADVLWALGLIALRSGLR